MPALEFTEIDLRVLWGKYAQRLSDKGFKIMEALLLINDPKVDGHNITYELPNQGSKIDFESEKGKLVSYLRGHLQNHNINIEVIVNEEMTVRKAYTDQDRYNRLHEINPDIELLKNTFGLYF
ncbi:MAG: DNA polymerase III [Flavobacterium sp.]